MEKVKEKGRKMGKGKVKGKERWKEDSLRNVRSTDARMDTQVILTNGMHCIGQMMMHWCVNLKGSASAT